MAASVCLRGRSAAVCAPCVCSSGCCSDGLQACGTGCGLLAVLGRVSPTGPVCALVFPAGPGGTAAAAAALR